jgi:hypothetical protein
VWVDRWVSTGVAAGGLHHGVALLEQAAALRVVDHRDGQPGARRGGGAEGRGSVDVPQQGSERTGARIERQKNVISKKVSDNTSDCEPGAAQVRQGGVQTACANKVDRNIGKESKRCPAAARSALVSKT